MPRIIQSIHLSEYQARVMLVIHQAQTPELAFVELGNQDQRIEANLLGARDVLANIGLLEIGDNSVAITPEGEKVMSDEYLIDEMGEITEKGNEILQQNSSEVQPPAEKGPSDNPMNEPRGTEMAPTSAGGEMETTAGDPGFENTIFKLVNDLTRLNG